MKEANVKKEKDYEIFMELEWDEKNLKEGLVFDEHSCNLVGI